MSEGRNRLVLSLSAASAGLVLAALPVFMVGGLAVQIRAELGFGEAALGLAVTVAFVSAALAGPIGGRLADRMGAKASLLVGALLSTGALAGIGWAARSWASLAAMLALAGVALAFTDPGLAILVARSVVAGRQGVAFGVKEASIPTATLAAGLAVPSIALTVGWRWAFALGLIPLLVLLGLLRRIDLEPSSASSAQRSEGRRESSLPPRSGLLLVAAAAAAGSAAGSGVGVFLTESAVASGLAPAAAGLLLSLGSVAGIVTRIGTGVAADRGRRDQLGVMSAMLAGGAITMALSSAGTGPLLVIGTIGAFAGGWGWSGLLFLVLVRASPRAPGAVAGIGLAGLAIGNASGPLLFGVIAEEVSYQAAWLAAAGAAALAAGLFHLARPRFDRS